MEEDIFGGVFGGIEPINEFLKDWISDFEFFSSGCDGIKAGF